MMLISKRIFSLVLGCALSGMLFTAADSGAANEVNPTVVAKGSDIVCFNTSTSKYHAVSCNSAKRCTNCVYITRDEAKKRKGVPCKTCGGGEE